jgi:hypothetical protein
MRYGPPNRRRLSAAFRSASASWPQASQAKSLPRRVPRGPQREQLWPLECGCPMSTRMPATLALYATVPAARTDWSRSLESRGRRTGRRGQKPRPSRHFGPIGLIPLQLAADGQDWHGLYVLLILDAPLDDGQRCPTHGRNEVTVGSRASEGGISATQTRFAATWKIAP